MGLSLLNIDPGDSSVHSGTNFGGENQSGTAFAVRTIVKKGEDRFLACEDLRALFVEDDDELPSIDQIQLQGSDEIVAGCLAATKRLRA